jgi:hypothetical protein
VFAYIKTRTISLDTRINWTFSPNLTLQLFVQPFIASGAYSSFREFEKPRAVKKLVYGEDVGTISRTPASASEGVGASYTVDPDGGGAGGCFFCGSGFHYAIAARECGVAVGVSAGVNGVLRVDAAADGV